MVYGFDMRNVLRVFIALWYLLGWMSHVYLVFSAPETYQIFGNTAMLPAYVHFWQNIIMPHITILALLLAGFELIVGAMLISKGKWVKTGLVLSIMFNLFLVQMGLGIESADPLSHFSFNRLPNLIFIVLQIPLFWGQYNYSIPEWIQYKFFTKQRYNSYE